MAPKPITESSQPVFPRVLFSMSYSIVDQNAHLVQMGDKKVRPVAPPRPEFPGFSSPFFL
jgi:hypothetical protein